MPTVIANSHCHSYSPKPSASNTVHRINLMCLDACGVFAVCLCRLCSSLTAPGGTTCWGWSALQTTAAGRPGITAPGCGCTPHTWMSALWHSGVVLGLQYKYAVWWAGPGSVRLHSTVCSSAVPSVTGLVHTCVSRSGTFSTLTALQDCDSPSACMTASFVKAPHLSVVHHKQVMCVCGAQEHAL